MAGTRDGTRPEPGGEKAEREDTEAARSGTQSLGPLRRHWVLLALAVAALIAAGTAYWWFFLRNRVSTEDAYVHAEVAQVSARVPGTVLRALVRDDDWVEAGQPLVELDPADYRVAVDRARAALAEIEAQVRGARVAVSETDEETSAKVRAMEAALQAARERIGEIRHRTEELRSTRDGARADLAMARADFQRFDELFRNGAGSRRQREEALTAREGARARVSSLDAQLEAQQRALAAAREEAGRAAAQLEEARGTRGSVEVQRHRVAALEAARDRAEAEVESARLQLSYTTIPAAISGYVAQKSVQAGDRVQPGQALMAVVPLGEVYVEANFKETDLAHVRIGQPATVEADMYSGHPYRGTVAGIRAGTGAAFSLLPPENATGNWIKVVRRIPVRIHLDRPPPPERPLRLGMSTTVTIDTSHRSGPVLQPRASAPAGDGARD